MAKTLGATDIETPTTGQHAGLTPQQAIAKGLWGMIYELTLVKRTANLYREYHYVGSRGFGKQALTKKGTLTAASCAWETYDTSSEPVHEKLAEGGYTATWRIIGYGWTKKQCLAIEAKLIADALGQWGEHRLLNKAQVGGGKLTSYRNKYSKRKPKVQPGVRYS